MNINNIFFAVIIGLIPGLTFSTTDKCDIEFYDWDSGSTSMRMKIGKGRSKGTVYPNNAIIIQKDLSGKISAHHIGDLKSITNACITKCSSFDVIEHGANCYNYTLCDDAAIIKAYEQFKKNHEQN